MLAIQLCLFDDTNDSKSKLVNNSSYGRVVRVAYFMKNSSCDDLPQFNGDACKVKVSCLNSTNENN